MDSLTLILIAVTNFFLAIVVGLLALLIYKVFRQNTKDQQPAAMAQPNYHPAIKERLKEIEHIKPKRADIFCPNHPEEPGEANCAICDRLFCKACFRPFKSMYLCKEHLPLLMRHEWKEVITLKTSTADPEEGVRLFDVKKELFHKHSLATYVETHYKINVDHDYIETYLVLFSVQEEADQVKQHLTSEEFFKLS